MRGSRSRIAQLHAECEASFEAETPVDTNWTWMGRMGQPIRGETSLAVGIFADEETEEENVFAHSLLFASFSDKMQIRLRSIPDPFQARWRLMKGEVESADLKLPVCPQTSGCPLKSRGCLSNPLVRGFERSVPLLRIWSRSLPSAVCHRASAGSDSFCFAGIH